MAMMTNFVIMLSTYWESADEAEKICNNLVI